MILSVCTGNVVAKLAWFNEDRQGVYCGLYGVYKGLHHSYHVDGRTHAKLHRDILFGPFQQIPIDSITGFVQIGGSAGIPLQSLVHTTDSFNADPAAVQVIVHIPDLSGLHINITQFLIREADEAEVLTRLSRSFLNGTNLDVFGMVAIPLIFFPGHKLVPMITAQRFKD